MNRHVTRGAAGTRALVRAWRSEQLTFIAASLAYYAFVSLFPLLMLVIVAASVFGGDRFAETLAAAATDTVAPVAGELVMKTLTGADVRGGATLVGVGVLVWSGLKVFRGLDIAFSMVYGVESTETFLRQVRDALTALFAVGAGVATVVVGGMAIALTGIRFVGIFATPALVVGLTGALLPLYYLFPDNDVTLREALPGAVLAAVGWSVLSTAFRFYAEKAGGFELYGIVGVVLLLVTWFYVGSLVLLFGAVVNAVLAGRLTEEDIETEFPGLDRHDPSTGGIQSRGDDVRVGDRTTRDYRADERDESIGGSEDGSSPDEGAPDEGAPDEGSTSGDTGRGGTSGGGPGGSDRPGGNGGAGGGGRSGGDGGDDEETARVRELREQIRDLRAHVREVEGDLDERTVHRDEIERDLRRYVRRHVRRGHARGWGPYLVLLYGTAMTLGAFFYLGGGWAILAMFVVWLSTLGLYALMLIVGAMFGLAELPGRLAGVLGRFRGRP